MITNPTQLEGALKQLSSFQDMLEAMRLHCQETHSPVFPIASEGYISRIKQLRSEIVEYLRERPTDVEEAARLAAIDAAMGAFAHVPAGSEDFARRKQEEIDLEEARWETGIRSGRTQP